MNEDMEKLIKFFMTNPVTSKRKRAVLHAEGRDEQIFEQLEETRLTQAGMPQTIEESNFIQLDDGTTMSDTSICQKCGRKVRVKSLRRCACGSTCCIYCRKVWQDPADKSKQRNYCSLRHVMLHRLGLLQRF